VTLAQRRVLIAFMRLVDAYRFRCPTSLDRWLYGQWGTRLPGDLTPAQCRHASRQLNAWRYSIDGGKTT
jgi:hypothetical protein